MENNGICPICYSELHHPLSTYCKRCKRIIDRIDISRVMN